MWRLPCSRVTTRQNTGKPPLNAEQIVLLLRIRWKWIKFQQWSGVFREQRMALDWSQVVFALRARAHYGKLSTYFLGYCKWTRAIVWCQVLMGCCPESVIKVMETRICSVVSLGRADSTIIWPVRYILRMATLFRIREEMISKTMQQKMTFLTVL